MKAKEGVVNLLNKILTADLTAINQYFVHGKMCENWGYDRLYHKVRERSIDEMKDADELIGHDSLSGGCAECSTDEHGSRRGDRPGTAQARFKG